MPCFFFSYARADADKWVERFFDDLVDEVSAHLAAPKREIAFRDVRSIESGTNWPDELREALRTCSVFAYLHTPRFFASSACGREWRIFRDRLELAKQAGALLGETPKVQPVYWTPTPDLDLVAPPEIAELQHSHADHGPGYAREGLRRLAKRGPKAQYDDAVIAIADRIVRAYREGPLPAALDVPAFNDVQPLFPILAMQSPDQPNSGHGSAENMVSRYGKYAKFVFVASPPEALAAYKRDRTAYGEKGGDDWTPYLKPEPVRAAILAARVAAEQNLFPERLDFVEDASAFRAAVEKALQEGSPVVILIDLWTLCLERYHRVLRQFDDIHYKHCSSICAWNLDDPETRENHNLLREALRRTFPMQYGDGPGGNRFDKVTSLEMLKQELDNVLTATMIRINLSRRGDIPVAEGLVVPLPVITQPLGARLSV